MKNHEKTAEMLPSDLRIAFVLIILSRGTLAPAQTMEGFFLGESIPVNEKLSEIFLQLHISEKSGRGVPKITEMYGKDAFSFRENSIVVTIPFERINKVGNKVGNILCIYQKIIPKTYQNPPALPPPHTYAHRSGSPHTYHSPSRWSKDPDPGWTAPAARTVKETGALSFPGQLLEVLLGSTWFCTFLKAATAMSKD